MLLLHQQIGGGRGNAYNLTSLSEDLLKGTSLFDHSSTSWFVTPPNELDLGFLLTPYLIIIVVLFIFALLVLNCLSSFLSKQILQINNQIFSQLLLRHYQPFATENDIVSSSVWPMNMNVSSGHLDSSLMASGRTSGICKCPSMSQVASMKQSPICGFQEPFSS